MATVGASLTETYSGTELAQSGKGFSLGDCYSDSNGKEYIWVQASGAITGAGYACTVDENYQAAMLTTTNAALGDRVGVPLAAFDDDDYGWLQVKGPGVVLGLTSCAANVQLAATATAGALDDAVGTGTKDIENIALTAAVGGGGAATAACMLLYPRVGETNS